jgi:protein-disulfide isomerase
MWGRSSPAAALLAAAVALAAAGCSGSGGLTPGVTSEAQASATPEKSGAAGAAYPATGAAAEQPFNPFADRSGPPPGGREVIENPSKAEVLEAGPLPEMAWGRADAPVTVIKYASLTCPYCRKFHLEVFPVFKREYIDTGKVRFVIREFPIGKTSGNATIALRCAPADRYLDLYGKYLGQQATWVSQEVRLDPIFAVAQQVGMKRADFDACLQNQSMIDGLKWVKERGRKLGVIGTPNFFVDGKLVKKVLTIEDLRAMLDPLLAGPQASAAGQRG